jgi:hypothetical protein
LSGGRSSQIVDLTHKLRERPTPKFSEAVASCGRASHRILITGTEPWATGVNPDADMWINQASDGKKSSERFANYQNYASGYKGGTSS